MSMRYPLDCASTMFLLGRNEQRRYNIRLAAVLREPIDPAALQAALEKTMQKYPAFFLRFVTEGNRLYSEPVSRALTVAPKELPAEIRLTPNPQQCEAQVAYRGKRIYLEYFHAVSDGKGGMIVFLQLLAEYLSEKSGDEAYRDSLAPLPPHQQSENSYRIHGRGFQLERRSGRAYRIQGTPQTEETVSTYLLSVREVRLCAKQYQAGIHDLMSALFFKGIAGIQQNAQPEMQPEKIRLTMPINLRTRFASQTVRNFVLNTYPEIAPAQSDMALPALCSHVRLAIQRATHPTHLAGRCASASLACDLCRSAPLAFQRWMVQRGLENPHASSMTFSNMGAVAIPAELEAAVEHFEMTFSAKPETPYTACLISTGERMCLSILRVIQEPLLETRLEDLLFGLGISFEKTFA